MSPGSGEVWCGWLQVSDAGCCAIARITSLRTLNLKNCPSLTDECLAALTPLERLCHLRLQVYTPLML